MSFHRTAFALATLATLAAGTAGTAAAQVFVSAVPSTPTLIGVLTAGRTYTVSVSGIADLCQSCNSGGPLSFTADGKPANTPTGGYAAFAPNGLDHDPTGSSYPGTGGYGQGGMGRLLGSLLGSFTATPGGPGDFFVIGLGTTLTATMNESLYATVNDTYYADNARGYSVTLAAQAPGTTVPEPSTWALLGGGLVGLAGIARRRRAATA